MASLQQLISAELKTRTPTDLRDAAMALAARYGDDTRAILWLDAPRGKKRQDGEAQRLLLILTDPLAPGSNPHRKLTTIPPRFWSADESGTLQFAAIHESDFNRLTKANLESPVIWALCAMPCRLVWAADRPAKALVARAVSNAAPTLLNAALSTVEREVDVADLWQTGFDLAHRAQPALRKRPRGDDPVSRDPDRYLVLGRAAIHHTMISNELRAEKVILKADPERRIADEQNRWPLLRRKARWQAVRRLLLRR